MSGATTQGSQAAKDQARETVEAVVEIEQRVGVVPEQLASALGTLGELYAAMGQPNLAREPLERVDDELERLVACPTRSLGTSTTWE